MRAEMKFVLRFYLSNVNEYLGDLCIFNTCPNLRYGIRSLVERRGDGPASSYARGTETSRGDSTAVSWRYGSRRATEGNTRDSATEGGRDAGATSTNDRRQFQRYVDTVEFNSSPTMRTPLAIFSMESGI